MTENTVHFENVKDLKKIKGKIIWGLIAAVILLIVMLSIIDAILTLHLVDRGATELNPVMNYYLGHGPLAFFWVKYMLTSAALIIVLTNKTAYLFNTRFQVKILFVVFLVPFVLVIQWEIYLLYSVYP